MNKITKNHIIILLIVLSIGVICFIFESNTKMKYYDAFRYQGKYYTIVGYHSETIVQPGAYAGKIQSAVKEGQKPTKDFEANWNGISEKIYQCDTDPHIMYVLQKSEEDENQIPDVWVVFREGLRKVDDYNDSIADSCPYFFIFNGIKYNVPGKIVKKLPEKYEEIGQVSYTGEYYQNADFGTNCFSLGAKIYADKASLKSDLYIETNEGNKIRYEKITVK